MKILPVLALPLLLAACASSGPLSPEDQAKAEAAAAKAEAAARAVLCQPKGVYIGDAFNTQWNDQQRALYRASIDAQRILKCPNALELGYGVAPSN